MRIEMKLCPDLSKLDEVKPTVIETTEGITILSNDDLCRSLIEKDYALLKGTFEEKVKILKDFKEKNDIFFSLNAPMARFVLIEDD